MSQDREQMEAEVKEDASVEDIVTNDENVDMFDLPEYYDEEKCKHLDITLVDGKISKADFEKLEDWHKSNNENADKEPTAENETENEEQQATAENETENEEQQAAAENEEKENSCLEIGGMEEDGPRTEEKEQDWVQKYDALLTKYGQENNNEWTRDNEPDENGARPAGLKGKFKNGAEVHYADKDKLSVKTPEGEKPAAAHFKEIVALAKENEQTVKLGSSMTPEFRAALIEACASGGVEIQNMSEEDREIYNRFKPADREEKPAEQEEKPAKQEEKPEIRAAEVKDTDENGNPLYKVNPKVAGAWMTMYQMKAESDKSAMFDQEIKTFEKQLAGGAYKVTGEEKARAQLLMMKYVQATEKGETDKADLCATALQKYDVDTITRTPPDGGKNNITTKPYAERSDEEKAKIQEATEKVLPQKAQSYDPAVWQAMKEASGQTRQ